MSADHIPPADQPQPVLAHLLELRRRLIRSLAVFAVFLLLGFVWYDLYAPLLLAPLGGELYVTRIEEAFTVRLRVAGYAGLVVSLPYHVWNVLRFIFPALTRRERRGLCWLLAASFALALAGAYLGYCQVLPLAIRFLTSSELLPASVAPWLDYRANVLFAFRLVLAFVVLFQAPLVMLALLALRIVSRRTLWRGSRFVIVGTFVLAAIMTPPDVVSQVGLALPLVALFYGTLLVAKLLHLGADE